ncbi:MAG: HAMP domain-containing histidine kinase [Deltaproteobacteria bacterium]|nr:HAMP domain-containing histidine kinase [Deltaproteobacteria bacterium]
MKPWRDLSVASKLYVVVGTMAVLIACELMTLRFAMNTLSAVRAFVGGEALWSKAQKDAVQSLLRYNITGDERDYEDFTAHLLIPDGDHLARLELSKPDFSRELVHRYFGQGGIHDADIDPIIALFRRFHSIPHLARAIEIWRQADEVIPVLKTTAEEFHYVVHSMPSDKKRHAALIERVQRLNNRLTSLESDFSATLGEGSRWLERLLMLVLFCAVLLIEGFSLTLTVLTSRQISRGLDEINEKAVRVASGDFRGSIPIRSRDEIGRLAREVNQMSEALRKSHSELEARVQERTAENARLLEEARAALQARDEFFSIASHELRTPLTSLFLQLQLLDRELSSGSERVGKMLGISLQQARRLTGLIEELLDVTRIRLGKLELHYETCDLSQLVQETVTLLGPEAERAGSRVSLSTPEPAVGRFDRNRINQVITNLLINAIKYGEGKPIELRVEVAGARGTLIVADLGMGIAPEQQQRIFERFERAVSGTNISGLGLGLYITRQIIEAHGGSIHVSSEPGRGSTFRVELPLQK